MEAGETVVRVQFQKSVLWATPVFFLPTNSVLGTSAGNGGTMVSSYDVRHQRLFVGRPWSNIVTVFAVIDDILFTDGFD